MSGECTCGSDCECCCICKDPDYEPGSIGELAASMQTGEVRQVMGYTVTKLGWFPVASDPAGDRQDDQHNEDDDQDGP